MPNSLNTYDNLKRFSNTEETQHIGLTLIVKSLVKRTGVRTDNFHPWGDL